MKNIVLLSFLIFAISCSNNDQENLSKDNNSSNSEDKVMGMQNDQNNINSSENDQVTFITYKADEEVIHTFQQELLGILSNYEKLNFRNATLDGYELIYDKDEGDFFIRTSYNNDYKSTTALINTDNSLRLDEVSCTSKACSGSDSQCQPKGKHCTSCNGGVSDCTRTTISDGCVTCQPNIIVFPELILHYNGTLESINKKYKPSEGYVTIRV